MSGSRTYYYYEDQKGLTWRLTREEIGRDLRELYEVPKELPPKLFVLLKKLDVIEGKYLRRYAPPIEPRSVGPSDDDWPFCT